VASATRGLPTEASHTSSLGAEVGCSLILTTRSRRLCTSMHGLGTKSTDPAQTTTPESKTSTSLLTALRSDCEWSCTGTTTSATSLSRRTRAAHIPSWRPSSGRPSAHSCLGPRTTLASRSSTRTETRSPTERRIGSLPNRSKRNPPVEQDGGISLSANLFVLFDLCPRRLPR
jgi:hypothetical protein